MLRLLITALPVPKLRLQHSSKQLQQNLEARFGNSRVIATLGQLISDKGVLSPGKLVPAEARAGLTELGPDQIPARVGDVGVTNTKDEAGFGFQLREEVEGVRAVVRGCAGRVGARVWAQSSTVDVGGEVADCCCDAVIELRKWLEPGSQAYRAESREPCWGRRTAARRAR